MEVKNFISKLIKLSELKREILRKELLLRMLPTGKKDDKLGYEILQLKYQFNEAKPWFIRKMKF